MVVPHRQRSIINGVLFLDLKKAFDTVNNDILIAKLRLYGFEKQFLSWFESYLKMENNFVKLSKSVINQERSTWDISRINSWTTSISDLY